MVLLFLCLLLQLFLEVLSSEWVLCVQVQNFESTVNAEMINSTTYCCCDMIGSSTCEDNITNLQASSCTVECNPYFEMKFQICQGNSCSYVIQDTEQHKNFISTCISPLFVLPNSQDSMLKNITQINLIVTVWDEDPVEGGDNIMDNFMISFPESVSDTNQGNIMNVMGQNGVGILTLAYFNLNTDSVTSCSSVDPFTTSPTSTISPTETIASFSYLTSTVLVTSCPNVMDTSSSMPQSTNVIEEVSVHQAWIIVAIVLILISIPSAVTIVVLPFIIHCIKKGSKKGKESDNISS